MSFEPPIPPARPPHKPVNPNSSAGNQAKFVRRNHLASIASPKYGNARCDRCRLFEMICWAHPSYDKCWGCMSREKKGCGVHLVVVGADTPMSDANDYEGDDDDSSDDDESVSSDEADIREQYEAMNDFDFNRYLHAEPFFGPSAADVARYGYLGRPPSVVEDEVAQAGPSNQVGGSVNEAGDGQGPPTPVSSNGNNVDASQSENRDENLEVHHNVLPAVEVSRENCADWLRDRTRIEADLRLEGNRFAQRRRKAESLPPSPARDQALREVEKDFAYLERKRLWLGLQQADLN